MYFFYSCTLAFLNCCLLSSVLDIRIYFYVKKRRLEMHLDTFLLPYCFLSEIEYFTSKVTGLHWFPAFQPYVEWGTVKCTTVHRSKLELPGVSVDCRVWKWVSSLRVCHVNVLRVFFPVNYEDYRNGRNISCVDSHELC